MSVTVIRNVNVYAPEPLGVKDILWVNDKILAIDEAIEVAISGVDVYEIDGQGKIATPGFIDGHFHLLGGGGENGFQNRTPEVQLTDLTLAGVTTACGLLGTDGVGRDDAALLSKAYALEIEGITTYMYVGNYRLPVETVTDSIIKDIMVIDKCIGVGEIAIADHRNGAPTFEEFAHACADSRVGGLLAGKSGVVNIHVGPGPDRLKFIFQALEETDIPITNFLPTHIGRSQELVDEGLKFAEMGGVIDVTGNEDPVQAYERDGEIPFRVILQQLLARGISHEQITMSSDGQGSLPRFDEAGNFLRIGVASAQALIVGIQDAVLNGGIPLEIALTAVTSNVARILKLAGKGHLRADHDADILLLDPESLAIDTVIAKGQVMVEAGQAKVFGTFEKH
ncbi:beta-aspartyl-peptidase [Hutsoniella sourekii]